MQYMPVFIDAPGGRVVKNVQALIDLFGGPGRLRDHPISLTVPGRQPLAVAVVGTGLRGGPLLSVAHHGEQNSARVQPPALVVELIPPVDWWLPVRCRQDRLGVFREAVVLDGDRLVTRSRLVDALEAFVAEWTV